MQIYKAVALFLRRQCLDTQSDAFSPFLPVRTLSRFTFLENKGILKSKQIKTSEYFCAYTSFTFHIFRGLQIRDTGINQSPPVFVMSC